MSKAQLALYMGISRARIAAIERDPAAISVAQLMQILWLLNTQLVLRELPSPVRGPFVLPPGWQQQRPKGDW